MTLRTTFGSVIEMVRNECGISSNTSRGIDHLDHIKQLIKRHYKTLAEDHDWQHLQIKRDSDVSRKVLQAGSRYYDWPAALNPLKIESAWVKWGSVWLPVSYGITYNDRSAFDPDADQRSDPITNWSFYSDSQFEVWPVPASNGSANGGNEIAFQGQKKVEELTEDASCLDMDDILVSLMVSTEILAEQKKAESAQVKGSAAMARLDRLKGNLGSKTRYVMGMGRVGDNSGRPRHPMFIR